MRRKTIKRSKQLVSVMLMIIAFTLLTQEQIMGYIGDMMTRQVDLLGEVKSRGTAMLRNPLAVFSDGSLHNSSTNLLEYKTITTTEEISTTEDITEDITNGELNAAHTIEACTKYRTIQKNEFKITVRFNRNKTLLFCPIYKVGTTFWRRVLMIEREKRYSSLVNPYVLPFDREYPSSQLIWKENITNPFYKVMFTRDPYKRLFSFYVDKMLAPNPYFWKNVGLKVAVLVRGVRKENVRRECGHDITFPEFIKYVIYTLETRQNIDPHWIEMNKNCHPCEIKYDFIGKMETFQEDSLQFLSKLGLTKMVSFLETNGKDAASDDAIKDTLNQPFSFRVKYRTCMSFKDALLRAWLKLQIRGLIGNDTLDVRLINERTTKLNDVIKRANISRQMSSPSIRKNIRDEMYRKYWSGVPISDILKLQKLYATDFELFNYDKNPDILFHSKVGVI